ncbi:MAG: YggS family pyridoxal phosphate-dependent enzyme [Bacteroidetes bacterium]|nr:YggS family pyridoxal phosphate-dependent enzyme [Bacteroidota bacterium]
MDIKKNIKGLLKSLEGSQSELVAISKTKPTSAIVEAYEAGLRDFGENRVQELVDKHPLLPDDIRWHMVGHLQRNKVKFIAPFVYLIHSVDSLKLLGEIDKQGENCHRIINCLLQVHIAEEEQKFGFIPQELNQFLQNDELKNRNHIKVIGLMGMATFSEDLEKVRVEFRNLKTLFDQLKSKYTSSNVDLKVLSMGMTADYPVAMEEGSTMIRVGTAIFGTRN